VVPDIIVMAKALGGGLPLGAFCGRDDLIGTLSHDPPLGHITTFGGHPLSCAAGLAALEVIVRERLYERAGVMGAELIRRIAAMRSSKITAVRGLGLLVGIEFRDSESARRFVAATIARGVIINWTLNAEKVVRLAPPLTIATDEIDFALDAMQAALNATED
jgi:acetylornithine/succinyldiaminopimelate/putrescine aminotransferase